MGRGGSSTLIRRCRCNRKVSRVVRLRGRGRRLRNITETRRRGGWEPQVFLLFNFLQHFWIFRLLHFSLLCIFSACFCPLPRFDRVRHFGQQGGGANELELAPARRLHLRLEVERSSMSTPTRPTFSARGTSAFVNSSSTTSTARNPLHLKANRLLAANLEDEGTRAALDTLGEFENLIGDDITRKGSLGTGIGVALRRGGLRKEVEGRMAEGSREFLEAFSEVNNVSSFSQDCV